MHSRLFLGIAAIIGLATSLVSVPQIYGEKPIVAARSSQSADRLANAGPGLFELSVGYNYLHLIDQEVENMNGVEASAFVNVTRWLGLGGDFMADFGSETRRISFQNVNFDSERFIYVFGPRFSVWPTPQLRIFAQTLAGGVHANAKGSVGSFSRSDSADNLALSGGVGVDYRFTSQLSWRIAQVDYVPTYLDDHRQDNWRFSTGIVFSFGGKE